MTTLEEYKNELVESATKTVIMCEIRTIVRKITELIMDFRYDISLEFNNKEAFISTDMKRIFPREITQIENIFKDYGYVLNAISTKNKEFKGCLTFEISIN